MSLMHGWLADLIDGVGIGLLLLFGTVIAVNLRRGRRGWALVMLILSMVVGGIMGYRNHAMRELCAQQQQLIKLQKELLDKAPTMITSGQQSPIAPGNCGTITINGNKE